MPSRSRARTKRVRTIGVVAKRDPARARAILKALVPWVERRGAACLLERRTALMLPGGPKGLEPEALARRADLILVIGGDGTLLSAARAAGASRTPLLGVNLGSLGFLTETNLEGLYPALEAVLDGRHEVHNRMRLRAEVVRAGEVAAAHELLNDIVVNKSALARILDIHVEVDGRFMTTFKADGLIVATPTGSTAYSLSAGGPILDPSMDAMILSPICPHTLTNRPVVAPGASRVEVGLVNNHGDVYVTVDGQVGAPFLPGDRIRIRRSRYPVRLVHFPHRHYFDVLRQKLKWGGRVPGPPGRRRR